MRISRAVYILAVENPLLEDPTDQKIKAELDQYLRSHGCGPTQTVANTIFPQWTYDAHGSPEFYSVYLEKIYPRIKRPQGDWGRYFERMIRYPLEKKGLQINPLSDIVDKMKKQVSGRCFKNVYELTVYDPIRDAGPVMNRQCLSFLSFKLTDEPKRQLRLTALYRNHYYTERLLGNLVGLGRLMNFVATEVGVEVGPLTVVSTHAECDKPGGTQQELVALLERCEQLAMPVAKSASSAESAPDAGSL